MPLPNPNSRQWRKAIKRGAFRRREPRGDAVGVHVLDLGRTPTHTPQRGQPVQEPPDQRISPIPHLRAGHFRRVRVGPRDDWHYQVRWIAPTLVRGDQPEQERLVVRRLPPPATGNPSRGISNQQGVDHGLSRRADSPAASMPGPDDPHALEIP
jgi:hypothetical protein